MNGSSAASTFNGRHTVSSNPTLVLEPVNDTFALKTLDLPDHSKVKIGRQTGVTTAPNPTNGYFDSKVLSRVHAEVWSEAGKVWHMYPCINGLFSCMKAQRRPGLAEEWMPEERRQPL